MNQSEEFEASIASFYLQKQAGKTTVLFDGNMAEKPFLLDAEMHSERPLKMPWIGKRNHNIIGW